jgi:hypothetical protein
MPRSMSVFLSFLFSLLFFGTGIIRVGFVGVCVYVCVREERRLLIEKYTIPENTWR